MNKLGDFGVQSWCFRHFDDNAVVAQKVRGIGLDRIELCGIHADFNQPVTFKNVLDIYRQAGVSIISLGVQTFTGQESERNWFEAAKIAGTNHISCDFHVDTFLRAIPRVRAWSREFGIRVGIHCHGGYRFGGQPDVLDYLLSLGGPEIGLCIDTAWVMQIGPDAGNPIEWVKRYAGKIYGIHYKDFLFDRTGRWTDTIVGQGNLDLPAFNEALIQNGFDGMTVIEYEADIENPDPALKRCVESMRSVLK